MMSFDIKIDKDNILDALSIYHNLPMNEKTFVRLNAEKLIVSVEKETDLIFDGQYETLTFVREPAE